MRRGSHQAGLNKVICVTLAAISSVAFFAPAASAYRRPGTTELISVTSDGTRPSRDDYRASFGRSAITPDGRLITFSTWLPLVPQDINGFKDIYVRDRVLGITELVSVNSDGEIAQPLPPPLQPGMGSTSPAITPDGRFVTFDSTAGNLAPDDLNFNLDVFVHDRRTGRTVMASVDRTNRPPMSPPQDVHLGPRSYVPSISDDGRFVAFTSLADDLVSGDTNQVADVFVRDLKTDTTTRVSVASDGSQSTGSCWEGFGCIFTEPISSISGNGRFVAFDSRASDLVEEDTNADFDVFVHDLKTRRTERVSVASDGTQAQNSSSSNPFAHVAGSRLAWIWARPSLPPGQVLSRNGRYVTFVSKARSLVPNDGNNGGDQAFVHDRRAGRTERVSVTSTGGEVSSHVFRPSISATGRYVTFEWEQDSIGCALGRTCGQGSIDHVVVHDRLTGATSATSPTIGEHYKYEADGDRYDGGTSRSDTPAITPDGRFVTFWSNDQRLRPYEQRQPSNDGGDIFLYDRGPALGVGGFLGGNRPPEDPGDDRVCITPEVCITPNHALLARDARGDVGRELTSPEGADIIAASVAYRPQFQDLFLKIDIDHMPGPRGAIAGLPAAGNPAIVYGARFEVNDKIYELRAHKGVELPIFGLFDCTLKVSREIRRLNGGYGTAGESIVVSMPLGLLEATHGAAIDAFEVFSALGTYIAGPITLLDRASLPSIAAHPNESSNDERSRQS